jgi:hypothetical protein
MKRGHQRSGVFSTFFTGLVVGLTLILLSGAALAAGPSLLLEDFESVQDVSLLTRKGNGNYWELQMKGESVQSRLIPGHDGTGNALEIEMVVEPLGVKWIYLWFDPVLDISEYSKLTLWYNISHGVVDLARSHPFQVRLYDANSNRVEGRFRQEFPNDDQWLAPNQWHQLVLYLVPDAPVESFPKDAVVSRGARIDDTLNRQGIKRLIFRIENAFVLDPIFLRLDDIRLEK